MASETKNPSGNGETAAAVQPETALVPKQETAPVRKFDYDPDDPVALYMDTSVFDQLQRVAKMMSVAEAVPAHLRGKIADCFLVAAQAFRWRMDPFAVAQHTFVLQGKLGYEGKLVAAVINSHKNIEKRLKPTYSGEGTNRKVVMSARLKGEDEDRTIEGTVGQWATNNENWKKDPDQMLAYRGSRAWARRHAPEILLGVSSEEEIKETVELQQTGPGTYAAPPATGRALDQLTDQVAERAAAAKAAEGPASETVAAATPAEHASHSDKEIPLTDDDTLAAAEAVEKKDPPAPEPDPKTVEGNPFLRGAEKAREARKTQRTLTED